MRGTFIARVGNVVQPVGSISAPAIETERLVVVTTASPEVVTLLSPGTEEVVVPALSVARGVEVLDALGIVDGAGRRWVATSEFDAPAGRGRVVIRERTASGLSAPAVAFEAPPGSVLRWLRVRGGDFSVRDVQRGVSHRFRAVR